MSDASNSTPGESINQNPIHQQQSVTRLLSGLRAIRNLINRSSLNQIVVDRQMRQAQTSGPNGPTKSSVHAIRKNIEIVVNRLQDGETDEVADRYRLEMFLLMRFYLISGEDRVGSTPDEKPSIGQPGL